MTDDQSTPGPKTNLYTAIIEGIFFEHYDRGERDFVFERTEIERVARALGVKLPKNLGDLIYSFRYRQGLPQSVLDKAPPGEQWIILPVGRARYRFVTVENALATIVPHPLLGETKIPDSTPGLIARYALGDEQALLARIRYNRLIDTFLNLTCYSIQNHLRTTVSDMGQVETDEVYVGIDQRGAQYAIPVQAKGGNDKLGIIQVLQDFALCAQKFPDLICRPVAAQFMKDQSIALFAFEPSTANRVGVALAIEKHYRLVPPQDMTPDDLKLYRERRNDYLA